MFRKRLREVCSEEHQWRAQANLLLAYSYCNQALDRVRKNGMGKGPQDSDRDRQEKNEDGRGGDKDFRFDLSGIIMEGVVPVFTPCVAGKGSKVSRVLELVCVCVCMCVCKKGTKSFFCRCQ